MNLEIFDDYIHGMLILKTVLMFSYLQVFLLNFVYFFQFIIFFFISLTVSGASDTISVCISDQDQESDKLSVVSEADSGVVICGRSEFY